MGLIVVYVNGEIVLMPEESIYLPPFEGAKTAPLQNKNAPDRLRGAANQGASESISEGGSVSSGED